MHVAAFDRSPVRVFCSRVHIAAAPPPHTPVIMLASQQVNAFVSDVRVASPLCDTNTQVPRAITAAALCPNGRVARTHDVCASENATSGESSNANWRRSACVHSSSFESACTMRCLCLVPHTACRCRAGPLNQHAQRPSFVHLLDPISQAYTLSHAVHATHTHTVITHPSFARPSLLACHRDLCL